jgi:hypothetical protein
MQLHAAYLDGRHCEKLIDFIEKHCCLNVPYCLTAKYKCNLTQVELDEEYMGLYAPGQIMNASQYGQISYNGFLSNAFKLRLGHNVKQFLVAMKAATRNNIVEPIIRPAKVIPSSLVTVSYVPLLISILNLQRYSMKMNEWWMRSQQVGK